jgi:hypothetical protein
VIDPLTLDLFLPDGSARDPVCECGTLKSKHSAFHFRCTTFRPFKVDMSAESAAALAGANSAATKRARGQQLMPTLHLKGSTPKRRRRVREGEPA